MHGCCQSSYVSRMGASWALLAEQCSANTIFSRSYHSAPDRFDSLHGCSRPCESWVQTSLEAYISTRMTMYGLRPPVRDVRPQSFIKIQLWAACCASCTHSFTPSYLHVYVHAGNAFGTPVPSTFESATLIVHHEDQFKLASTAYLKYELSAEKSNYHWWHQCSALRAFIPAAIKMRDMHSLVPWWVSDQLRQYTYKIKEQACACNVHFQKMSIKYLEGSRTTKAELYTY